MVSKHGTRKTKKTKLYFLSLKLASLSISCLSVCLSSLCVIEDLCLSVLVEGLGEEPMSMTVKSVVLFVYFCSTYGSKSHSKYQRSRCRSEIQRRHQIIITFIFVTRLYQTPMKTLFSLLSLDRFEIQLV